MWPKWLLPINLASALYMTGLIGLVQVVHYPLFERVGEQTFAPYEQAHQRLTTWVVASAMPLVAVVSIALGCERTYIAGMDFDDAGAGAFARRAGEGLGIRVVGKAGSIQLDRDHRLEH